MKIARFCVVLVPFCVVLLAWAATCCAVTIIDRPGTILTPVDALFPSTNYSASDFVVMDGVPVYGRRVYDRFTVPSAGFPLGADISRVSWEMIVWNRETQMTPGPLEATSYDVSFYATGSGQPAANLYSVTFAPSALTTTLLGIENSPGLDGHNGAVYRVTADLPNAFRAAPNTQYWLSWQARTPTFRPVYGWTGNFVSSPGHTFQDDFDQNGQFIRRLDRGGTRHYTLEGNAVPEPSTFVLVTCCWTLVGLILLCRTKFT